MEEKPPWICRRVPPPELLSEVRSILDSLKIHTICESAACPNIGICFEKKVATFLILGDVCSRNCKFCAVKKGIPLPVDDQEPKKIAKAVELLGLKHVVITSVTRDDLEDQGVNQFIETILEIQKNNKETTIEVLIPDFNGNISFLNKIINSNSQIINHNIETVIRLYPKLRPEADYNRSLELLNHIKGLETHKLVKTGLMIGLGESKEEVKQTIEDLADTNCDILTIGQYLRPSSNQEKVKKYYKPEFFDEIKRFAQSIGFKYVYSGPFVRSSFNAEEIFNKLSRN
jgi:lipoic acid synthetase